MPKNTAVANWGKQPSASVAVSHTYFNAWTDKWKSRSHTWTRLRQGNWCEQDEWVTELGSGEHCWGYNVYGTVGKAPVGQVLPCKWKEENIHDLYIAAIVEQGVIVGHVPHAISSVCNMYIHNRRNVTFRCQVTGTRHYSCTLLICPSWNMLQVDLFLSC